MRSRQRESRVLNAEAHCSAEALAQRGGRTESMGTPDQARSQGVKAAMQKSSRREVREAETNGEKQEAKKPFKILKWQTPSGEG